MGYSEKVNKRSIMTTTKGVPMKLVTLIATVAFAFVAQANEPAPPPPAAPSEVAAPAEMAPPAHAKKEHKKGHKKGHGKKAHTEETK